MKQENSEIGKKVLTDGLDPCYSYFWRIFCHLATSANGAPKNMSVLLNINADRNIRTNLQSRLVTRPNFGAPTIFESKAVDSTDQIVYHKT